MSKNEYALKSAAYNHPVFRKVVPTTYIEVTGPDAKQMLDAALGQKSRGDVTPNATGNGFIVTGLSEKAAILAMENLALVDAGEEPQRKAAPDKDDDAQAQS